MRGRGGFRGAKRGGYTAARTRDEVDDERPPPEPEPSQSEESDASASDVDDDEDIEAVQPTSNAYAALLQSYAVPQDQPRKKRKVHHAPDLEVECAEPEPMEDGTEELDEVCHL